MTERLERLARNPGYLEHVAVGIALAGDPPHGSGHAELPHPALALGHNADVAEE